MRATYRMFKSTLSSWDSLFAEAAAFASGLGPERVISISHSEDANDGVVVVWYWEGSSPAPGPRPDTYTSLSDIEKEVEGNL